jgi:hypothetical protein
VSEREEPERTSEVVRPWSSTWVRHYDRASRRRHQRGGYGRMRAEAKRRRRIEGIAAIIATAGAVALVAVFHAILTR